MPQDSNENNKKNFLDNILKNYRISEIMLLFVEIKEIL